MADEKTSAEIASIAGALASMNDQEVQTWALSNPNTIRRMAASLLTQARDREPDPPPE